MTAHPKHLSVPIPGRPIGRNRETLGALDDELLLTIEDDGRGFDEHQPFGRSAATRFGILGMRERAESLGGDLRVLSTRGAGTRVEARLPWKPRLERQQRAAA
jgi:glucose-6-phosphate-specific signal transduction histidine kinase